VEAACADYLRYRGYTVVSPKKFVVSLKTTEDLVAYFYDLLNKRVPGEFNTSYNKIKDLSVAKRFIEDRMRVTGAQKSYALNECGEIVKTIFDNYDEFNFKYDIGFYALGQGNMKWITNKAIQIMNKKLRYKHEEEAEALRQKALDAYEGEAAGFDDLDSILKRMEED
jgi:hypothetical protein